MLEKIESRVDKKTLENFSHDTSIFSITPSKVFFPRSTEEVQRIVQAVHTEKKVKPEVSITARSAGTDMTGGSLTHSYVLSFTEHMNAVSIEEHTAVVEPGCFYRDFEDAARKKDLLLPSYPASKNICALGGMLSNDSGGELTLKYGKTHDYVDELEVVLSDGSKALFGPLSPSELAEKKKLSNLEGSIYRDMDTLLTTHAKNIESARPTVSKNSAGYALWRIKERGLFNLAQLIVGSQGTLGFITKARVRLIKPQTKKSMVVVFLRDIQNLPHIVQKVLAYNPESFESYDNHTFSLAVQFLPQLLTQLGLLKALRLGIAFIPEIWSVMTHGVPKMVLMAEFAEHTQDEADGAAQKSIDALRTLGVLAFQTRMPEKYWLVRRESFSLLRKNLRGMRAAPFIDDFVVHPDDYPTFLPRLQKLLQEYNLIYTIAGHIGNGNFHIIPLMDLSKERNRKIIPELSERVYALVAEYKGSITGEHNDGIIRTPYLEMMFGKEMCSLFEKTKKIFDPHSLFNPGKKVIGTVSDIKTYMVKQ